VGGVRPITTTEKKQKKNNKKRKETEIIFLHDKTHLLTFLRIQARVKTV
jgi:hypothetical protein